MAARPRGHTQRKLNDYVYSFLLFVSCRPHYQVESFKYIESDLLVSHNSVAERLNAKELVMSS